MEDKLIVWLIDGDELFSVDTDFDRADLPEGSAFGVFDGDQLLMDFNELDRPINMEYFIRLWKAQFPEFEIGIEDIIFEFDGEHSRFKKDVHKGDKQSSVWYPTLRKEAMPPINTPAGNKLKAVGDLGESIISLIPRLEVVRPLKGDGVHDVDFEVVWQGQKYGVEVKANNRDSMDPYRYKLTGYGAYNLEQIRLLKTQFCEENGLTPGTLGITIDFTSQTFDACFLPGEIKQFLGGARTVIAQDVPFANTGVRPLAPERNNQSRVPRPFLRDGETSQPAWKNPKVRPEAPSPDEIFG